MRTVWCTRDLVEIVLKLPTVGDSTPAEYLNDNVNGQVGFAYDNWFRKGCRPRYAWPLFAYMSWGFINHQVQMNSPIDDDCTFLNYAAHANDNGTCNRKYGSFRMHNRSWKSCWVNNKSGLNTDWPEPMVISPLSSTSWQTTALEWIVNLSRLGRTKVSYIPLKGLKSKQQHIGGIAEGVQNAVTHHILMDTLWSCLSRASGFWRWAPSSSSYFHQRCFLFQ